MKRYNQANILDFFKKPRTVATACTTNSTASIAFAFSTPVPSVTTPAPSVTTPAPSVSTPAPSVSTPAPSVTTPAPSVTTPAPSVTTPAPSVRTESAPLSTNTNAGVSLPSAPFQPDSECIKSQALSNRTLKFQQSWFKKFPWLHYAENIGGVLCFTCVTARQQKADNLARCAEEAFVTNGFSNWKKACEKFSNHEKSQAHKLSLQSLKAQTNKPIMVAQLNKKALEDQRNAWNALLKIITTLKFLARQGLAIRGKELQEGNFKNLLSLRMDDDTNLKTWLEKKTNYTGVEIQNQILQTMSHMILRDICKQINDEAKFFGIVVDGTQDVQGNEQESICVRYVSKDMLVHEEFIGLYHISSTTGDSIANMLQDAMIRLQLPIENLRAQTYDGASNMAGHYKGCQAEIKKVQPLAGYVHCGAHVTHLVVSKAIQNAQFIRDALDCVQELGNLYKSSGKFKTAYLSNEQHTDTTAKNVKPICPTRWLTRTPAVEAVLKNYRQILDTLSQFASNFGTTTATRANGIYRTLSSGSTILGMMLSCKIQTLCKIFKLFLFVLGMLSALPLLRCLERLNRSLQSKTTTVSGMMDAVSMCAKEIEIIRQPEEFHNIFEDAELRIVELQLSEITMPRLHRTPKRLTHGEAQEHQPSCSEEHYRAQYFSAVDSAAILLTEYFKSTDIEEYRKLSDILLRGTFCDEIVQKYPELSMHQLRNEVQFFRTQFHEASLEGYKCAFLNMAPEVRRMFPLVETLLRLLLTSPASSCEAERSFSCLRRVKTWLRSTMRQDRLNHLMLCHVHQERLDALSVDNIAEMFVNGCPDIRRKVFGIVTTTTL